MSAKYPNCSSETCVFEILEPFFGEFASGVAMNATCFPFSCEVAHRQAQEIVVTAKARMIYGMGLKETVNAACADAERQLEEAMRSAEMVAE